MEPLSHKMEQLLEHDKGRLAGENCGRKITTTTILLVSSVLPPGEKSFPQGLLLLHKRKVKPNYLMISKGEFLSQY